MLPRDLEIDVGVAAADFDKTGRISNYMPSSQTERNGRAPLEGDVTDARMSSTTWQTVREHVDEYRRFSSLGCFDKNNVGNPLPLYWMVMYIVLLT